MKEEVYVDFVVACNVILFSTTMTPLACAFSLSLSLFFYLSIYLSLSLSPLCMLPIVIAVSSLRRQISFEIVQLS